MKLLTVILVFVCGFQASAACDTKDAAEQLNTIQKVSAELATVFQAYPQYVEFANDLIKLQDTAALFRQFMQENSALACKDLVPHGQAVPVQYAQMKKSYVAVGAQDVEGLSMKFRSLQLAELEFEMFLMMPIDRN